MSDAGGDASPFTAPLTVITGTPGWRGTFSSFRFYNYRLYFFSMLLSSVGGWMARVAIDWLVFELTGNIALVGLTVALQLGPYLILAPWAGVLSDRHSRRRTLILTTAVSALGIAGLAALVLAGVAETWHVYAVAVLTGIASAIDGPSRAAFVAEIVGTDRLQNAISLNATTLHLGGLIGPAVSGILIAVVGSGWSIAINAVTSAFALVVLVSLRKDELIPAPKEPRATGQIRAAVAYALAKPTIFWPILLVAFVATFGMQLPVLLTTAASTDGFDTGAAGYGLYSSIAAVGAFIGAILSAGRLSLRLRSMVAAAAAFGVIMALCGVLPGQILFLVGVGSIGVARVTFVVSADAMTQLSANAGIRGRVVSLYMMVLAGGAAIGGILIGSIAQTFGMSVAFLVAGGVPAIAALIAAGVLAHTRKLRLRIDLRPLRGVMSIEHRKGTTARG